MASKEMAYRHIMDCVNHALCAVFVEKSPKFYLNSGREIQVNDAQIDNSYIILDCYFTGKFNGKKELEHLQDDLIETLKNDNEYETIEFFGILFQIVSYRINKVEFEFRNLKKLIIPTEGFDVQMRVSLAKLLDPEGNQFKRIHNLVFEIAKELVNL